MPSFKTPKGKTVNYRIGSGNRIYTEYGTDLYLRISGTDVYCTKSGRKAGTTANLDVLCQMEYKKQFPGS